MIRGEPFAAGGAHRSCPASGGFDCNRFVVEVARAFLDRIGAHGAKQAVGVEPALVLQAERGAGKVLCIQPGKSLRDLVGFEQGDLCALGKLHVAVGAQRRLALLRGEHEIGAADQAGALSHRFNE